MDLIYSHVTSTQHVVIQIHTTQVLIFRQILVCLYMYIAFPVCDIMDMYLTRSWTLAWPGTQRMRWLGMWRHDGTGRLRLCSTGWDTHKQVGIPNMQSVLWFFVVVCVFHPADIIACGYEVCTKEKVWIQNSNVNHWKLANDCFPCNNLKLNIVSFSHDSSCD